MQGSQFLAEEQRVCQLLTSKFARAVLEAATLALQLLHRPSTGSPEAPEYETAAPGLEVEAQPAQKENITEKYTTYTMTKNKPFPR